MTHQDKKQEELVREIEKLRKKLSKNENLLQAAIQSHKNVEKNLIANNEILENIFENVHILISFMDTNFNIVRVNKAYADAAGKSAKYFFGKSQLDLFPDKEVRNIFQNVLETGNRHIAHEKPLKFIKLHKDETAYLNWSLDPVVNNKGQVIGLIFTLVDVTEQHRIRKLLVQNVNKLDWANQELSEFAFSASHDLQEPLRKIRMFTELIAEEQANNLNQEGKDFLKRIHKACNRMKVMLDALLKYSRITTPAEDFKTINLNDVINNALSNLSPQIEKLKPLIETDIIPHVEGDPDQLMQLFQNLISNALKYQKRDNQPVIKISGEKITSGLNKSANSGHITQQNLCRIYIEDNGIGFDEKYLDQIFLPFQRLHGRFEYEGSGMGLTICKKIIERHNGAIDAKSSPGTGSTFIVDLPLKQAAEMINE